MKTLLLCGALALPLSIATALPAVAQDAPPVQRKVFEIFRVAPGQHVAFLEAIASYDEANRRADLPPRELYVHESGAGWDFILVQPASTPPDKAPALNAAWEELDLPSGADFFVEFRKLIADHNDITVKGPTTAADFLATRKKK